MFKQSLIAFVAAGLVSVAMPFATAQSNDQQAARYAAMRTQSE